MASPCCAMTDGSSEPRPGMAAFRRRPSEPSAAVTPAAGSPRSFSARSCRPWTKRCGWRRNSGFPSISRSKPIVAAAPRPELVALRDLTPDTPRGLLFRTVPRRWRVIAERLGATTINANHRWLDPQRVAEIRGAGYPLLAYTVNDPQRTQALFSWGVTSVFTDVLDIILPVSRGQPPVWHSAAGT